MTKALVAAVFAFYLVTLAPSLNWADGARMQLDVMLGGSTYYSFEEAALAPTDGLPFDRLGVAAWDHPLYVMLGQLFLALPLGEPLWRINLMSAVFGAAAIALLFQCGRLLVRDDFAALLGALALAVAHTFWFFSVTSEAYSLNMLFMAAIVWLALRWSQRRRAGDLAWLAFLAGLGMANHIQLGLALVVVGGWVLFSGGGLSWALRPAAFLRGLGLVQLGGLFLLGFSPWWVQFGRMARLAGLPVTLQVAAGFPWLGERFGAASLPAAAENLLGFGGWLTYQFMPLGVALGIYGLWSLWRTNRGAAAFIAALILVHMLFSANYRLADQFNFHLPAYLAFSLALAAGLAQARRRLAARLPAGRAWLKTALDGGWLAVVLLPIGIYALVPPAMRSLGLTEARLGVPPVGTFARDAFAFFLDPNSRGDDSAARFARSTLAQLAPGALVFTPKPSDQETYVLLRYVQLIEGARPDVHLELVLFDPQDDLRQAILAQAQAQRGCRPLYLASLNPATYPLDSLQAEYAILPEANLYRLTPRQTPSKRSDCPGPTDRWAGASFEELIRSAMRIP